MRKREAELSKINQLREKLLTRVTKLENASSVSERKHIIRTEPLKLI